MLIRAILPQWAINKSSLPKVVEADCSEDEILQLSRQGYNLYYFPNHPSVYDKSKTVDGKDIDVFKTVFVDCDLKHGKYTNATEFINTVSNFSLKPSKIVLSGNGVHAYWNVSDLDAGSFLRLNRRLCRHFDTDPAVSKILQLMRVPNTINWKDEQEPKLCETIDETDSIYTAEQLDQSLPKITPEDEEYCKLHYDKTYGLYEKLDISDELPEKWYKVAVKGTEMYSLFYGKHSDRSKADYRLAHLLSSHDFTKEEAMSVLMNTNKASTRSGHHNYTYAENIVTKIWDAKGDDIPEKSKPKLLSRSAGDILDSMDEESLKGERFPCDPMFDATEHGFRRTQVLGLIGGAGAGKTAIGFNFFIGFAEKNPDSIHLAVSLEQPETEYAQRWKKISNGNKEYYNSVHILGNYNPDGTYRNLSLQEIEDYIKVLEKDTGKKVGCVMIDHIGVLKKKNRNGENQGLMEVCQYLKAFAVNTNTFLIMQSQAPREKAGIGDVELDKDAAYGTGQFEWYCDYVVTTWQPLKRVYDKHPDMTVTCIKFCKIRHKNILKDNMKEDVRYALKFDPNTEKLNLMSELERSKYHFLENQAINLRKADKKSSMREIADVSWVAVSVKDKKKGKDGESKRDTGHH